MYLTEQKQCSNCEQWFDLSNFYYDRKEDKIYYRKKCKSCHNNLIALNRNKNKDSYTNTKKAYYDSKKGTLSHWLKVVVNSTKYRAKIKGLEFNLTRQWILTNLPEYCPVLGIKLQFGGNQNTSPSLDRFDNNKGYTTDNVRIISFRANALKSNATLEELEAIVRYMKNES